MFKLTSSYNGEFCKISVCSGGGGGGGEECRSGEHNLPHQYGDMDITITMFRFAKNTESA